MGQGQLEIRLRTKIDRNGDEYLIGSATDIPAMIDLRDSTFIVFYPPEDEKEGFATLVIRKYQPPRPYTDPGTDDPR